MGVDNLEKDSIKNNENDKINDTNNNDNFINAVILNHNWNIVVFYEDKINGNVLQKQWLCQNIKNIQKSFKENLPPNISLVKIVCEKTYNINNN